MPAPLKIKLTSEEDRTLLELSAADGVPRRTKYRAIAYGRASLNALRLNAQGYQVREIAKYLDWAEQTVRQTLHRWQESGLTGLWEAPGRGKTRRWTTQDWQAVEQWLTEERRYSARQISQKLASERNIVLGQEQVRRILKKRVGGGKESEVVQRALHNLKEYKQSLRT